MAGNKYLSNNAGAITEVAGIQSSAGAGDAGKIPAVDSTGRLDSTFMPVGVSVETDSITTSESLSAGDLVNIYASSGTKCRKADGSTNGKEAHGFVLAGSSSPGPATVYRTSQSNTQKTSMTPGAIQYLSDTVPGGTMETAPTTAGHTVQMVGIAKSDTEMIFQPRIGIVLA